MGTKDSKKIQKITKKNNLKIDPILINNVDLEQFSDELSSGKSSNKLSPLDLIDNNNLPPINKYCNVDSDDDSDDYIYSYKKNILDSPPQSPMPSYTPFSYPPSPSSESSPAVSISPSSPFFPQIDAHTQNVGLVLDNEPSEFIDYEKHPGILSHLRKIDNSPPIISKLNLNQILATKKILNNKTLKYCYDLNIKEDILNNQIYEKEDSDKEDDKSYCNYALTKNTVNSKYFSKPSGSSNSISFTIDSDSISAIDNLVLVVCITNPLEIEKYLDNLKCYFFRYIFSSIKLYLNDNQLFSITEYHFSTFLNKLYGKSFQNINENNYFRIKNEKNIKINFYFPIPFNLFEDSIHNNKYFFPTFLNKKCNFRVEFTYSHKSSLYKKECKSIYVPDLKFNTYLTHDSYRFDKKMISYLNEYYNEITLPYFIPQYFSMEFKEKLEYVYLKPKFTGDIFGFLVYCQNINHNLIRNFTDEINLYINSSKINTFDMDFARSDYFKHLNIFDYRRKIITNNNYYYLPISDLASCGIYIEEDDEIEFSFKSNILKIFNNKKNNDELKNINYYTIHIVALTNKMINITEDNIKTDFF